jgi:hypothetical protein
MKNRKKHRGNVTLRVAAVLLVLVVWSMYFVSGMYARYSTGGVGTNGAKVAKFSINVTDTGSYSQQIAAKIKPGESQASQIKITNNSEVTVQYEIKVTSTNNIKALKYTLNNESTDAQSGKEITFTTSKQPSGKDNNVLLNIWWDKYTGTGKDPNLAYIGMVDYIIITVTAVQVD